MTNHFTFDFNSEADLIFKHNGHVHNFGYNYNMSPFCSIWLYHKQTTGENLFKKTRLNISEGAELNRDLEEKLKGTIELSNKLPLEIEEFNLQLSFLRLHGFGSGIFKTLYKWSLNEDGLFHLTAQEKQFGGFNGEILALSPDDDSYFLKDYLSFLKSCPTMGACYDWSSKIIKKLREN
jgi:hypothetical protein